MSLAAGIRWALRHAIERRFVVPLREHALSKKTEPFVYQTPDGFTFTLDPRQFIDRAIFTEGIYERRFLELVKKHYSLLPGSTALDVGANIGNHAIYLSRCFKRILCFEPCPIVLERLRQNIRLNRISNLEIHPVGLSNRAGSFPFHLNESSLGSSGFVTDATGTSTISLPVVIGDEYLESVGLSSLDFIKVDVESHEPEVFAGLKRTIARYRPVIAFEYYGQNSDRQRFDQIAECTPGYVFAEARHPDATASAAAKLAWHVKHMGAPVLVRFEAPERRTYENVLAFPGEESFDRFTR
jgi:FkbM family methyltransferase